MSVPPSDGVARTPRLLADIAQTLESGEDGAARVTRVLALLGELVPYDRCGVLRAPPGAEPELQLLPEVTGAERTAIAARLEHVLQLLGGRHDAPREHATPLASQPPGRSQLILPLAGLDQIVGVLWVERRGDAAYDEQSLVLLTVVAAQLGAYVTTLWLREAQARAAEELGLAHAFQQLLVGIVSHDLRNPLGVIVGSAGMLLLRSHDPRQVRTIERIISSGQRATRIINDLLDVTRGRLGAGIPITPQRADLAAVASEIVDEMRAAHPGRDVELDAPSSVPGEWDADRLAQVLTNLVGNALHHGPADTPVRVVVHADDDGVVIEVQNRGRPIPPETLANVFDPFKRGNAPRTEGRAQGLGLGLYIVQQVVAGHGGRVEARSTAGEGTTFTVILPRVAVSTGAHP